MIHYNKLVRDKIPEIIKTSGKTCSTQILNQEDYSKVLKLKLLEECNEYLESGEVEELADIMEVMRALIEMEGSTYEEVEEVRLAKADKRGGFEDRVFLEYVDGE